MVRKFQPNSGKQNLSVIQKAAPQAPAPTSNSETVREAIMRELSTNPKWKEEKTSGKVSVIVGHRPLEAVSKLVVRRAAHRATPSPPSDRACRTSP